MIQTKTIKDFSKVYDVYMTRIRNSFLEERVSPTLDNALKGLVRQAKPVILTCYTEISINTSPEYKIELDTTNVDVPYNRMAFTQECSFGRFLFEQYFSFEKYFADSPPSNVVTAIDSYGSIPSSICEVSTQDLDDLSPSSIYKVATKGVDKISICEASSKDVVSASLCSIYEESTQGLASFRSACEAATKNLNDYNTNNDKEKTMNNFINFDFGPCTKDNVRMSGYGLAVKNPAGNWVSYDKTSGAIIDVSVLNFDASDFFYKIPAAISDVAVGDMIIHNRKPMYITETKEKTFCAIDVVNSEIVEIIPTRNMFGFDFVTKVVSLIDMMGGVSATDSSPFGNMLPFLMMGGDNDNLLPVMIMSQGNESINPMMMYCLMKNGNNDNFLPLMFMMNNNRGAANN